MAIFLCCGWQWISKKAEKLLFTTLPGYRSFFLPFALATLTSKELDWGCDLVSCVKYVPYMKKIINEEFWPLPASAGLSESKAGLFLQLPWPICYFNMG